MAFSAAAIILVAFMLYITTMAYNKNNRTWFDTFRYVWSSVDNLEEVFNPQVSSVYEKKFEGYEHPETQQSWVYLSDLAKPQTDLISLLKEDSPNRIGTNLHRL